MATHSSTLSCLENFHGLRSLVGYSPWTRKEWDMTEGLHFHFLYTIKQLILLKGMFFLIPNYLTILVLIQCCYYKPANDAERR